MSRRSHRRFIYKGDTSTHAQGTDPSTHEQGRDLRMCSPPIGRGSQQLEHTNRVNPIHIHTYIYRYGYI